MTAERLLTALCGVTLAVSIGLDVSLQPGDPVLIVGLTVCFILLVQAAAGLWLLAHRENRLSRERWDEDVRRRNAA